MTTDLVSVFSWWTVWWALGLMFLPFTVSIFPSFFDKGYAFSKILAILLISYTVFLLGSVKLVPFHTYPLFGIVGLFLIINLIWGRWKKVSVQKSDLKTFALEEGLFLGGLLFWSFIKAHEPSIHGLEKFMDYGFINSILRSDYFPPKDMWMAPLSINYYYFGHLVGAVTTKLSGLNPAISYNLILATLFGLTLSASFSLGANLYHSFSSQLFPKLNAIRYTLLSGSLSAFLVTLGGNLQTIYAFFQGYSNPENPIPFWLTPIKLNFSGYWYPNATRFIPFTIHEFPIYSFVVSDLHGHVFDIPFILLALALLIKIFHSPKLPATNYLLLGLLVAVFLMTNILDGPIYLLVIGIVLLAKQSKLSLSAFRLFLIGLGAIIFSLPFWLSFKPFSSGIGVICAPTFLTNIGKLGPFLFEANHCTRSPLWMLLILWGFPLFVVFSFLASIIKLPKLLKSLRSLNPTDILILILAATAFILIAIPEFFYVKDIYPTHWRANTVFKFGYQAFIMLGLTSGYMITRLIIMPSRTIRYTLYAIFLLFSLIAIYPYFAINSYFNGLKNYQGLNGLGYLSSLYPSDYLAILWLQKNISGQPVILEAQGDSYTDYARVSANTGLPTVIGWPVHEWLWRGSYDEAGKRSTNVTTLYESPDLNQTKDLLQKYNVSYVFIGSLERQKYLNLNEQKFQILGKIIFELDQTRIYKIN